jgi:AAA+ ATPase superfamily predicted ATPase
MFETDVNELFNRYSYHAPQGDQVERYARIRDLILQVALECVAMTPPSYEQGRALNALDEAMFLFNAAIARNSRGGHFRREEREKLQNECREALERLKNKPHPQPKPEQA